MSNNKRFWWATEVETYRAWTIHKNEYGFYCVYGINCHCASSVESARRAVDRYEERAGR